MRKRETNESELPNASEDEYGLGVLTPMEALEANLETGTPISEEQAQRLVKGGFVSKRDLVAVPGGFEYVGDRWKA